ncbi:MAG: 4Fe-4S dicluster domain-containing protein [Betaproteobacteria bacterium]|nr:4Fe-4S dicluster domain-containing protein [Betaproteobacteria bacterium]
MARLGMVIDLQKCVGCGACAIACKAENNTRTRANGQSHNWADFVMRTEGTFPKVTHWVLPVLCNHCTDAPCVAACPVTPKAMFRTPEGVTMHDSERCIGCQMCQNACPYSNVELNDTSLVGEAYSVISFNPRDGDPQPQWSDKSAMIPGCTASGAETAAAAGAATPLLNQFLEGDTKAIRKAGVVEKCTFCYHRTSNGMQPACVEVCPSNARIFGDQDDPKSEISRVLKARKSFRLREDKGTKPNVHYVGSYTVRA